MGLREKIASELKSAMREKDATRLSTLRLVNAAIKDQDIIARSNGNSEGVDDGELIKILARMVKQRQESARAYEEGGRLELALKEQAEIAVLEDFLPQQLTEAQIIEAVETAITDLGATSIRDMGRVMGQLKAKYAGRMDFGTVGPLVRERIG